MRRILEIDIDKLSDKEYDDLIDALDALGIRYNEKTVW